MKMTQKGLFMVCFFNELSKCPRLYPPRAAMNAEEVRIQGQRLEVMRQCGALIRDAEARPDTNLTEAESCGKEKLQRRIKVREIVIFPTDKSGKLVLSTPNTYMEAASVHTAGDKELAGTAWGWWRRRPTGTPLLSGKPSGLVKDTKHSSRGCKEP